jgi:hypothetical protein
MYDGEGLGLTVTGVTLENKLYKKNLVDSSNVAFFNLDTKKIDFDNLTFIQTVILLLSTMIGCT